MTKRDDALTQRIAELEKENRLLREEQAQLERIRRMWQDSIEQLKRARKESLRLQNELEDANAALSERIEELRAANNYIQQLAYSDKLVIDNMQEAVVTTDADGIIVAVNPAFCRTTGYSREEAIGQNPRLLKSGRHPPEFYVAMWQAIGEQGHWHGEIWNRRKNGEIYPELLSITAIRDWSGRIVNYSAVFTDIGLQKRMESEIAAREEQIRLLLDSTGDGLFGLDLEGRCTFCNPAAAQLLGYAGPAMLRGRNICALVRPKRSEDAAGSAEECRIMVGVRRGEGVHVEHDSFHRADGTQFPVAYRSHPIYHDGRVTGAVVSFNDISERLAARERLSLLSTALENSPVAVVITDSSGQIEYVNPRFAALTGYGADELLGHKPSIISSGDTSEEIYADLWHAISRGDNWYGEMLNQRKNGELFWVRISVSPVRDSEGNVSHMVALEEDITERKKSEEQLWWRANFDPLTHLPNRRLFNDRLAQLIAHNRRSGGRLALLFVDLDDFKPVNDRYGHGVGDTVLVSVAGRLRHGIRESDTVARLAGDEFTVILQQAGDDADLQSIAEKLIADISAPYPVEGIPPVGISCSIGIATFPEDGSNAEQLLKAADGAMYRAKQAGRHTWRRA